MKYAIEFNTHFLDVTLPDAMILLFSVVIIGCQVINPRLWITSLIQLGLLMIYLVFKIKTRPKGIFFIRRAKEL